MCEITQRERGREDKRRGCSETHRICYREVGVIDNFSAVNVHKQCCLVLLLKTGCKSKAVPLHAMEAHGGRGGIAPTHN
jgi:hypothetical protein